MELKETEAQNKLFDKWQSTRMAMEEAQERRLGAKAQIEALKEEKLKLMVGGLKKSVQFRCRSSTGC